MEQVIRIVFTALIIFAFSANLSLAATILVPSEQSTIQAGIDAAIDGDLVLVEPGTYVENIDFLGKAIVLQSESGAYVTVIDGNQTGSVVTFISMETDDAVIDGFTIRNGSTFYGGGITCGLSFPIITNCVISNNDASQGGGIYCELASPTIMNCDISHNSASEGGGITINYCGDLMITNCTISNNTAYSNGGGIGCSYSSPAITNCTISGNIASGLWGGGILNVYSGTTITNCILWGDSAPMGPEIFVLDPSEPEMSGTKDSLLVVEHSDIEGGWPGEGNIDSNPLFVGGGDYHLTAGSPCIDTGTDGGAYTDKDGEVRPLGAGFDMGADEYSGPPDCLDGDMDGYSDMACGGYDCDDTDPDVNPGAEEICDNGIDDDCDGLADSEDTECKFTLLLEASYEEGTLSLTYTIGAPEPTTWAAYLILTYPEVQFVSLWGVSLPVVDPPIDYPMAFALPQVGWVGIWTALLTEEGAQAADFAWVDTGWPTQ